MTTNAKTKLAAMVEELREEELETVTAIEQAYTAGEKARAAIEQAKKMALETRHKALATKEQALKEKREAMNMCLLMHVKTELFPGGREKKKQVRYMRRR